MTLLTATKVRHCFGGLCALADFNLELRQGELMGIIGPNGAGKTTVFNLITGVYRATEGSIRYRGAELVGLTPHQITALRIARTFQNIRLFRDLSVLDNVRIAHYSQTRYSPWRPCCTWAVTAGRSSASSTIPAACSPSSSWSIWPAKPPATCPTAPSAGWKSPARWPSVPNCCCWMNRPRG